MNNKRHYHSGNSKCFRKCVLEMGTETKHIYIYKNEEVAQSCLTLSAHGLYSPWSLPGQNTGVGILSFCQGFFPTQGLNPGLLHGRRILYQLNYQRSLCVCVCVCVYYIPKVEFVRLDVVVNYKLALAVGTCYLP